MCPHMVSSPLSHLKILCIRFEYNPFPDSKALCDVIARTCLVCVRDLVRNLGLVPVLCASSCRTTVVMLLSLKTKTKKASSLSDHPWEKTEPGLHTPRQGERWVGVVGKQKETVKGEGRKENEQTRRLRKQLCRSKMLALMPDLMWLQKSRRLAAKNCRL